MATLPREVLEVEVSGHKANIIQWKRSIEISRLVIDSMEKRLKTYPPKKVVEKKTPVGIR